MIAPTMTGALFNSERRQTSFLVELDGLVMRALLALPRNEASLAGKNLCFPGKFPAPSLPRKVPGTFWNIRGRDELFRTTGGMPIRGCREELSTDDNGHSALRRSTAERLS